MIAKLFYGFFLLIFCTLRASSVNYCPKDPSHPTCKTTFDVRCGDANFIKLKENTEEDKKIIVDLFNKFRNDIAAGTFKTYGGSRFSQARAMEELFYDSELEEVAKGFSRSCNSKYIPYVNLTRFSAGQVLYKMTSKEEISPEILTWNNIIQTWTTLPAKGYRGNAYYIVRDTDPRIRDLQQVISGGTDRVGCAIITFKNIMSEENEAIFTCFFGPGVRTFTNDVYEIGKVCTQCFFGCDKKYKFPSLCTPCLNPVHTKFQKSHYFCYITPHQPHTEAAQVCAKKGDLFYEPESRDEFRAVVSRIKIVLCLSGNDAATEGVYIGDETGKPNKYLQWDIGEPNGNTGENCLYTNTHKAVEFVDMNDLSCSAQCGACCRCDNAEDITEEEVETCIEYART